MPSAPFYVYILRCNDNSFYVGLTEAIMTRLAAHNTGKGSTYTRRRRPVQLVHLDGPFARSVAYARERQLKGWSNAKKQAFIDRSARCCERLRKEISAMPMGTVFSDGHLDPEVRTTERQLRDTLSMLKWDAKVHAEEAETTAERGSAIQKSGVRSQHRLRKPRSDDAAGNVFGLS